MNKADAQSTPVVSGSQVFAAGLASTTAAFVTSKFGVAGTILGAALTTMIITGGAAILNAYLQSVTGTCARFRTSFGHGGSGGSGGKPHATRSLLLRRCRGAPTCEITSWAARGLL